MRRVAERARTAVSALTRSGAGTVAATLSPRISSVAAQWLLALTAGPASVAVFVTCTSQGAAVVSVVATGLAPVIAGRAGLLATTKGTALLAVSVGWISAAALLLSLAVQIATAAPLFPSVAAALFAGSVVFSSCAPAAWATWQARPGFHRILWLSLACSPLVSSAVAIAGAPLLAVVAVGCSGAVPTLTMLGPTRWRASLRTAVGLVRRAVPLSLLTTATAIVYPVALAKGTDLLGARTVGLQTLYWSFFTVANIASQSYAARLVVRRGPRDSSSQAIRTWLWAVSGLVALLGASLVVFRGRTESEALPSILLVGAAVFIVTDGLSLYFVPASGRNIMLLVTFTGAAVAIGAVLSFPGMLRYTTVLGPSFAIASLRLFPMLGFASTRWVAAIALVLLGSASALALGLP